MGQDAILLKTLEGGRGREGGGGGECHFTMPGGRQSRISICICICIPICISRYLDIYKYNKHK